jgi:hypothetical protein
MMDFLRRVWWLIDSPHPCSKSAQEKFQENFGEKFGDDFLTKAILESLVSRLVLNPNLAKKAAPQDGYLGTAFSRQSLRNANHQPARTRLAFGGRSDGRGSGVGSGNSAAGKEQGRQRSIPQTALPAPDIEIGLRRPVDAIMRRFMSGHM